MDFTTFSAKNPIITFTQKYKTKALTKFKQINVGWFFASSFLFRTFAAWNKKKK